MSVIDVSGLTFAYEGSPELIFDHVSFQFDTDWKLGFTGRNGRGKTTFLRLLQGKYPYSGTTRYLRVPWRLNISPMRRRTCPERVWRR